MDLDALTGELPAWQARTLEAVLSGQRIAPVAMGRANGRSTADRLGIKGAVALSGHIHVLARDGLWCVTGSERQVMTLGPLWEKIR